MKTFIYSLSVIFTTLIFTGCGGPKNPEDTTFGLMVNDTSVMNIRIHRDGKRIKTEKISDNIQVVDSFFNEFNSLVVSQNKDTIYMINSKYYTDNFGQEQSKDIKTELFTVKDGVIQIKDMETKVRISDKNGKILKYRCVRNENLSVN